MFLFFASIGKEEIVSIHRAKRGNVDVVRRDACFNKLIAVRLVQINSRMPFACRREEFIRRRKSFFEDTDNFGADFVAAAICRGTDRGAHIFGARSEFTL